MTNLFTPKLRFWLFAVLVGFLADLAGNTVRRLLMNNSFAWSEVVSRYPILDTPREFAEFAILATVGGFIVALGAVVAYMPRHRRTAFIASVVLAPVCWDITTNIVGVFFRELHYVDGGEVVPFADALHLVYFRTLDPDRFWVIGAIIYGLVATGAGMFLARRYGANAPRANAAPAPIVERVRSRARLRDRLPRWLHRFVPAVS